jgi:hypothetical protein
MLLPDNIHPELSIYYNGSLVLEALQNKDNQSIIDLYCKNFLIDEEVEIILVLTDNLDDPEATQLEIRRNFLSYKNAIRQINGEYVLDREFEDALEQQIFPDKKMEKPTFRQVLSHNIRYKDESINNTLKTLDKYTSDIEYETLYLYLLGCTFNEGAKKLALTAKINQEETFKERLEKKTNQNNLRNSLIFN